jgi:hypothetical protein
LQVTVFAQAQGGAAVRRASRLRPVETGFFRAPRDFTGLPGY